MAGKDQQLGSCLAMTDRLVLTLHREDDGAVELCGRVEVDGFGGHGAAWFDPRELIDFAARLGQAFPIRESMELRGGIWSLGQPSVIERELLALAFKPINGRGRVICQVRLASATAYGDDPDALHALQVDLSTSYEELSGFSKALARLAAGRAEEAVLRTAVV